MAKTLNFKAKFGKNWAVINKASTTYAFCFKEGMHIRWHNEAVLNIQVRSEKIQLSVYLFSPLFLQNFALKVRVSAIVD